MAATTPALKLVKPDVNDRVEETIAALAANFAVIDALFPVGCIRETVNNVNPSTYMPGTTWTLHEAGRVTVCASTAHPAGTKWGEEKHVLTVAEMPSHAHGVSNRPWTGRGEVGGTGKTGITDWGEAPTVDAAGGGAAHENCQPSVAVYRWVRTA